MALELINSTNFSDAYLRKAIRWICKHLDMPYSQVWKVRVRNRRGSYSGHAYGNHTITVSIGRPSFPIKQIWRGISTVLNDRTEMLISILTHELCHLRQHAQRDFEQQEVGAEGEAALILDDFRKDREALENAWNTTSKKTAKPKLSLVDTREAHAKELLAKWERKLKFAKTKIWKYRTKVRYYERKRAARPGADQ